MSEPQFLLGIALSLITVLFHMTALSYLGFLLCLAFPAPSVGRHSPRRPAFLSLAVLALIAVHLLEATLWALVYCELEEFDTLPNALYFSVVTATTLGFGDITLSTNWQLLSVFEAMTGLLLFGASTACIFQLMTKTLPDPFPPEDHGPDPLTTTQDSAP
ncbi:MAG: potassium channel family protein [Pseudomonadota bacterium]